MTKLVDLAKTIRSKNAGPDKITFDIIFPNKEIYDAVKRSQSLTRRIVTELYRIEDKMISDFVEFDPAYAIKFTIIRKNPSGSPGDADLFGCQQYAPLLDLPIRVQLTKNP